MNVDCLAVADHPLLIIAYMARTIIFAKLLYIGTATSPWRKKKAASSRYHSLTTTTYNTHTNKNML